MADLDVIYKISADITGLQSGVNRAAQAAEGLQATALKVGTALAGMFTVGAVISFGREVLAAADTIQKLADKTSLTTDEVQKLQYIGGQTAVSVDALAGAVQNLQQRLGGNDAGAIGAIKKLGINLEELRALGTYDQTVLIAEGLKGIQDPALRAALAAEIFGKSWKEILPAIAAGMREVGEEATTMSAQAVKGIDRLGDALLASKQASTAWAGELVFAMSEAVLSVADLVTIFNPQHFGVTTRELKKFQDQVTDPDLSKGALAFEKTTDAAKRLTNQGLEPLQKIVAPTGAELSDLNRQLDLNREAMNRDTEAAKKAAEKQERFRDSIDDATVAMRLSTFTLHRFGAVELPAVASSLDGVDTEIHDLASSSLPDLGIKLQDVGRIGAQAFGDLRTSGQKFKGELSDIVSDIPDLLVKAFTGGGGIGGALRGLGSQIGSAVFGQNGPLGGIGKTISNLFQTGLGIALPGIGSALGSLIGPAIQGITKLFSSAEKQVNPVRQAFIDAAGGLDVLNRKASEAGVTLERVLNAKNPEQYKKAIDELNDALKFQDDSMKFLDDTVKKYGLSIDQLGPKFAQQKLTEQAFQLEKEFRALEAAGVDVETISSKMADSINEFFKNALKTGAVIPDSLKPILHQMAVMGILIDDNGDAVKDLEKTGVKFSKTLDDQFSDLISTIEKLTKAIARGLGIALDDLPEKVPIDIDVRWNTPEIDDMPEIRVPGLGDGRVPTHVGRILNFAPRGADVIPAMLSPDEWVLNTPQQDALTNALSGQGPSDPELLAELRAIRRAVSSDRVTSVQINGVEVVRASHDVYDANTEGQRTELQELAG